MVRFTCNSCRCPLLICQAGRRAWVPLLMLTWSCVTGATWKTHFQGMLAGLRVWLWLF
jgi:hypothetical protein